MEPESSSPYLQVPAIRRTFVKFEIGDAPHVLCGSILGGLYLPLTNRKVKCPRYRPGCGPEVGQKYSSTLP